MLTRLHVLPLSLLLTIQAGAQNITASFDGCPDQEFDPLFQSPTGQNFYFNFNTQLVVRWNEGLQRWELALDGPDSPTYAYSELPTTPAPPCFSTGTWVNLTVNCPLTNLTGACDNTPTGLLSAAGGTRFSMMPNPARDRVSITLPEGNFQLEVFTALGGLVHSRTVPSTSTELDLHGMPRGIYMVRVSVGARSSLHRLAVE